MIERQNAVKVKLSVSRHTSAVGAITLELRDGEFVSLLGPPRSGKSTILRLLGLLEQPAHGYVAISGIRVSDYSEPHIAQLRGRHVGFLWRSPQLLSDLSVFDNVRLPLLYRRFGSVECREMTLRALAHVGLSECALKPPSDLSPFQQQRAALARAIVGRPTLVLADEPLGDLDSHSGERMLSLLRSLTRQIGLAIVMATREMHRTDRAGLIVRLQDRSVMDSTSTRTSSPAPLPATRCTGG